MRTTLFGGALIFAMLCAGFPHPARLARAISRRPALLNNRTSWQVSPSFKFDALCFLNVLTGDQFYVSQYEREHARFAPRLNSAARAALAHLKRKVRDEQKGIISAFLCLYFSATEDRTLEDMLRTLEDSARMKENLKRTVYFSEEGWRLFEALRGDLRAIFLALKEMNFADYWKENILPEAERQISIIERKLADYDVTTEVEARLGFALPSKTVTVYMLHFARPHGIRITGARFIADISYPFAVILQNAVHEMMHPPFDLKRDRELRKALDALRADSFLMDKVRNHNPSFGYNSFESFIEEDCVRALDQIVCEKFNLERDARKRWLEEDEGMHVLSAVLYSLMRQENFRQTSESFRDFLLRMLKTGRLARGKLKPLYQSFYSSRAG